MEFSILWSILGSSWFFMTKILYLSMLSFSVMFKTSAKMTQVVRFPRDPGFHGSHEAMGKLGPTHPWGTQPSQHRGVGCILRT